jgi:hypothetical protein
MYILPEFKENYNLNVENGKSFIKDKKIAITGLAHNLGDKTKDKIYRLFSIRDHCHDCSIFLYDYNSTDHTSFLLKDLHTEYGSSLAYRSYIENHETNDPIESNLYRFQVLANLRNESKEYIQIHYSDYDYVMVVDPGFLTFSVEGILNTFGWLYIYDDIMDAMAGFSYIKKPTLDHKKNDLYNYDSHAFRPSWWDDIVKYKEAFTYDPMMWFSYWQPPVGSNPIRVNSAFGGICIYKMKYFLSGEYDSYDNEHVCFHKSICVKNNDFNLYANPSQLMILN